MFTFPNYRQSENKDCGPTCLKIIFKYYGKSVPIGKLRSVSETTRIGSSLLNVSKAAELFGFRTFGAKVDIETLEESPLPCILHWGENHYVVLYKIKRGKFYISDPAFGLVKYSRDEFLQKWTGQSDPRIKGICLFLEPTGKFFQLENEEEQVFNLRYIGNYLSKYKRFIWQLLLGLVTSSLISLIFPFLTQSIVDTGITNQDIDFIYLVLIAQLVLYISRTGVEVLRGWILLHLSSRVNISLVSDFFIKLMSLPIAYFDARVTGDLLQRINDHSRIERLLTNSSLSILFSLVNLIIFSIVLAIYSIKILLIFLFGSVLYFTWVIVFLKRRKVIDHRRFEQMGEDQGKMIELVTGMQEIKLHNAETIKRWSWEQTQVKLFKTSLQTLKVEQLQNVGSGFINEVTNIIITAFSAQLVISGEITLGMMLAISYIVGQLNAPIIQFIRFSREVQDAVLALRRLSEVHNLKEEPQPIVLNAIPDNPGISIQNLSFKYPGTNKNVLNDISFHIGHNEKVAIVGASGSGKTTLMKLLLKYYDNYEGTIQVGQHDMKNITPFVWRNYCGAVMQEGSIFNDTVANNIAFGVDHVDHQKLLEAIRIANLDSFVFALPQSYNTLIGSEGLGISTGQKQRILIARSIYKNPDFLLFDEATSALDAENERVITNNLDLFLRKKTAIIIAHRLSTVVNADKILVLHNGQLAETGTHQQLVEREGIYYKLIKEQLNLGK